MGTDQFRTFKQESLPRRPGAAQEGPGAAAEHAALFAPGAAPLAALRRRSRRKLRGRLRRVGGRAAGGLSVILALDACVFSFFKHIYTQAMYEYNPSEFVTLEASLLGDARVPVSE